MRPPLRHRSVPTATPPMRALATTLFALATTTALAHLAPLAEAAPAPVAEPRQDDADERYRYLVGLVDKGMHGLAVEEAERFLRAHPRHPKATLARYRLASSLHELGRTDEAAPHFAALAEERGFEYRAECLFRHGQALLAADDVRGAMRALEAVLASEQTYLHPAAGLLRAESAFRAGDLETAAAGYGTLLRDHGESPQAAGARRGLVWCAWRAGEREETARRARAFLARHADDPAADEVRILLAETSLDSGDPEGALALYRQVADGPSHDAALRGIGHALAARGERAAAARSFAELRERYPASPYAEEAWLQEGVCLLQAGEPERAREVLSGLAQRAPSARDPETLSWLAEAERASGDEEAALATLERALAARPAPEGELATRLQLARAEILQSLGRTGEALGAYASTGSDYGLANAALTALAAGELERAAELAERLLSAHPDSEYRAKAHFVVGESRFQAGAFAEASASFRAALEASPLDEERARARSRIGWCHHRSGDDRAAAAAFAELLREHPRAPESAEGTYMLGRTLASAGDPEGATAAWTRYVEQQPDGPQVAAALYGLATHDAPGARRRWLERLAGRTEDDPLVARALFELAEEDARNGEHRSAAERYGELLRRFPRADEAERARYGLGWSLLSSGSPAAAAEALAELERAREPELRLAALELAVFARADAGDAEGAHRAWALLSRDDALRAENDARRLEAARRLARLYGERGEREHAQALYEELLESLQSREVGVEVLVEGCYLALDGGDVDRAEAQVRVAERQGIRPERVAEASFFVGEARFERGETQRALELYRSAAATPSPVAADALYKLTFTALSTGDAASAEEAARRLVDEHPENPLVGEGRFLLGESLFQRGRFADAAVELERLRQDSPRHEVLPKALFRLGLALGELERWEPCANALADLVRRAPDFPNLAEAELWRGRALARTGRERAADAAFERVLALDSGSLAAAARLAMGRLRLDAGRTDEALSEFLKVAVLYADPELVPEALVLAGRCLELRGEPELARARYREVLEKHARSSAADAARAALAGIGPE